MAASSRNNPRVIRFPALLVTGLALLATAHLTAAADAANPAVDYGADLVNSDLRSDTMELIGTVSFVQGANSIEAERARMHSAGSSAHRWTFEDSVHVVTAEAELRADTASANLVNGRVSTARVEGSPAHFEQLTGPADSRGRGRASIIEYDVVNGLVKLSGGNDPVWFTYGKDKNELRTNELTYNLRDGSVSTGRVHGTIRLKNQKESRETQPAGTEPTGRQGNGA